MRMESGGAPVEDRIVVKYIHSLALPYHNTVDKTGCIESYVRLLLTILIMYVKVTQVIIDLSKLRKG
jgi:hypothetical protein